MNSSFPIIVGKDGIIKYVPGKSYPEDIYVDYNNKIYRSKTVTSTVFIPTEWELLPLYNIFTDITDGLVPASSGSTGTRFLCDDKSWKDIIEISGGTVTSVGVSGTTGISVSGSPITTFGQILIGVNDNNSIPLKTDIANWNESYNWGNHADVGYLTGDTYVRTFNNRSGNINLTKDDVELALTGIATGHTHPNTGGTVTSVGLSVPSGLTVSSTPITDNGIINIQYESGYTIPTITKQTNWDEAYNWGNHADAGYLTGSKVDSFNGRQGAVTLKKSDIENVLTDNVTSHTHSIYYPNTNPSGFTDNQGTVTSVGLSVPSGLTVSNTPVTGNSTINIQYESGYTIPTIVKQENWDDAYGWGNHADAGYLTGNTISAITGDTDGFLLKGTEWEIKNSNIKFSTDETLSGATDSLISSSLAIKQYIDNNSGSAGHTIQENDIDLVARTNLNFITANVETILSDDAINDQTDIALTIKSMNDLNALSTLPYDLIQRNATNDGYNHVPSEIFDLILTLSDVGVTGDTQLDTIIFADYSIIGVRVKGDGTTTSGNLYLGTTSGSTDVGELVLTATTDSYLPLKTRWFSKINDTNLFVSGITAGSVELEFILNKGIFSESVIENSNSVSFGLDNQIPFTNSAANDFDYSSNFKWDGKSLLLNDSYYNVLIGQQVRPNTMSGSSWNVAIGSGSLYYLTGGTSNIGIGYNAGSFNQTGSHNIAIGQQASVLNKSDYNIMIGYRTGYSSVTGTSNVFLGAFSGYYETGSNKLFIDNQNRTDEATSRTNSLIYGEFNSTPNLQRLSLNASVEAPRVLNPYQTLVSATGITMNIRDGQNYKIILEHNATITITNLENGDEGNIIVTQDNVGGRTLTILPTPYVRGAGAGTIALTGIANSRDVLSYSFDGDDLYITYGDNYTNA